MSKNDENKPPQQKPKNHLQAKSALALRNNLQKRKEQTRARDKINDKLDAETD